MSLTDDELLRLEEYVDGALTPLDAEAVRNCAAADAAWAAALDGLCADPRDARKLFAALEPGEAEADHLASRWIAAARRRSGWSQYGRIFRMTSAAAACLAVGLLGGWLLRDRSIAMNHLPPGNNAAVSSGHSEAKVAEVVAYQVELTDEAGRVTAVQKFDSLDKAREFADDLSRWQERQRQMRNGAAVVVADKF